ncbi:DUF421 domain-containing protein [Pluralibacter gergoviae]|uniref:DUF421 domain-containing protein n=1 Tax=Pluralibacter gergoviae TaxID=61647 RepID=UPI0004F8BE5C|nr:DUF421 domain-containing protein [Pluralibacter gergoviae]AIR02040.1 hypothetical protein LG71_20005 [Pluralibacter gergoviae]
MKAFDLHRMALDKAPPAFLWEVALRCLYTFVLVFLFLKITGRRGVRQMSLFEVLIILTLGSAAGDVAFYDNVPMLPVLVVFITLALLYRLVIWLMARSERLGNLLEGRPVVVVEDGELAWEKLRAENLTELEFFMELRLSSVAHLGQVRRAIMETDGQISIYYFADDEVRPGLVILPAECVETFTLAPRGCDAACVKCSAVVHFLAGERKSCPRCANGVWSHASREKRIA